MHCIPPMPFSHVLTVTSAFSVGERGPGCLIYPPMGVPRATFIADDVWAAGGPWRHDIWQAKHDKEGCSWTDVGIRAERRKRGVGFRLGGRVGVTGVMKIGPTINQTISVQASATCFELKAQALVFYDAINVRAEQLEGSLGEKYSRWPFYICTFDGIPDRTRTSQPSSAKAGFLMF